MTRDNNIFYRTGWDEFDRLRRGISGLFDYAPSPACIYGRSFDPPVNIAESADGYRVEAELPGMKAEEIDLAVNRDILTVKGERKGFENADGMKTFRSEIPSGRFHKTLSLPRSADGAGIKADFRNGILTIAIPRKDEVKPRQIEVNKS